MLLKLFVYVLLSALATSGVRQYALRKRIIDLPNERSSHAVPTPRGGGLGFVLLFLSVMWWVPVDRNTLIALVGGVIVAVVGWIDDRLSLPASVRALVHTLAACWAMFWLGGVPEVELGFAKLPLGVLGWPLGVLGIVWLINLYNFMDGIDGLAGGQAVVASVIGGAWFYASGLLGLSELSWTLAALVLGFLIWNWAPAKIFMGDVASGFLGYTFSVLAISSERHGGPPILLWALLLGVFIVDATATLIRRMRRGEKWYEAHRSHAYQLATQLGYSHAQVSTVAIVISIGLGALGWAAWYLPVLMTPLALLGFGSLLLIWRAIVVRGLGGQATSRPSGGTAIPSRR